MSQYGQAKKSCIFQGFAKIVLYCCSSILQGLRTQILHKHIQVPPMSMKTILIPPYTPQTPPRHLQGTRKANRQQQRPTDIARHTQMAPVSVLGCLRLSVYVCWHLLSSFGILCLLEMSGGCLGDVWGCLGAEEWYSWTLESLGCVCGVYGFSVPAVSSYNTILAKP